ncbi:thermonuclease family protein [Planctomycetes bacterium K23_9]|uniref:thermonuclease family protein n=1 Tax=Stieleria marina TaxID=1930275 RepID=UPI00119DEC23
MKTHTDTTSGNAVEIAGELERAMDGDSFWFCAHSGERLEIRLEGIDCPEKGQPFAEEAKTWLEQVTSGRTIWLLPVGKDKYGRTLANVHNGEIWINGESVRRGLAWHYVSFNKDGRLARLQMDAQEAQTGIWSDRQPIPPWTYRKTHKRR